MNISKKKLFLTFIPFFLLGLVMGYVWGFGSTPIREIEVVSLEARLEWSAELLRTYYGFECEEKQMITFAQTNIELEILDFQTFVTWLNTNGFNKCYYEYRTPALLTGKEERGIFWVWFDNAFYYWELKQ